MTRKFKLCPFNGYMQFMKMIVFTKFNHKFQTSSRMKIGFENLLEISSRVSKKFAFFLQKNCFVFLRVVKTIF